MTRRKTWLVTTAIFMGRRLYRDSGVEFYLVILALEPSCSAFIVKDNPNEKLEHLLLTDRMNSQVLRHSWLDAQDIICTYFGYNRTPLIYN